MTGASEPRHMRFRRGESEGPTGVLSKRRCVLRHAPMDCSQPVTDYKDESSGDYELNCRGTSTARRNVATSVPSCLYASVRTFTTPRSDFDRDGVTSSTSLS